MTYPYHPPKADVASKPECNAENELAGRWRRLGGAIIDSLIGAVAAMPMILWLQMLTHTHLGTKLPFQYSLLSSMYGFVVFILLHSYFLKKAGQTIGKKIVGIKIVNLDGELLNLQTILFKRYFPIVVTSLIPIIGPFLALLDILFIFGKYKRCVHDYLAGSKVVVS